MRFADFKLWLDQNHQIRVLCCQRGDMLQDQGDGNKADIHDNQCWCIGEGVRVEFADVLPLQNRQARMIAQAVMQLVMSDINGPDMVGLSVEQHMRETTR